MNPTLRGLIRRLLQVIASSVFLALSRFLGRILQPIIAFITFNSLKVLIKVTKSRKLRELYNDMKKKYEQGDRYYE